MRKTGLLLATAALAMLLAGGVAFIGMGGDAEAGSASKTGKIVFYMPGDFEPEVPGLFTVRPNGTQLKRIVGSELVRAPKWSPDGTKIAIQEFNGETYDIGVVGADGSERKQLTPPALNGEDSRNPSWSPDGKKLVFTYSDWDGNQGRYTMNADGSDQRLLFANSYGPSSWSPDGERIMFVGYTALEGTSVNSLCTVTPLGTDLYCFMPREETIGGFDFSPDGQKIAYVVGRKADGSGPSLEIANFGAAEGRTIFAPSGSGFWGGPTFSPDGKKVAFSVSSGGLPQIYTMNIDGTRKTRLGVAGMSPDWGPASTSVR